MIKLFNVWTVVGLLIFYFGPIDWPGSRSPNVGLYVLVCLAAFNLGARYQFAEGSVAASRVPFPKSRVVCYAVVVVYMAMTFLQLDLVTGRSVFSPSSYSLDFGAVYTQYGHTLATADRTTASATAVSILKAAVFPFVLLIFVDRFKRDKPLVVLILGTMLISSLFRGTDKELFDILVLTFVTAVFHGARFRRFIPYAVVVPFALILFAARRSDRFHNALPACLPNSDACFNYQSWLSHHFGYGAEQAWIFVSDYMTNGYQGLDYALKLPWHFNYGLGELPPLQSAICRIAAFTCGGPGSTYNDRLSSVGWDTSTRWTTAYTTLANDVTFWLVPVMIGLLGVIYAKSRVLWNSERNPEALCAILLIAVFWTYSSANLQTAITMDWVAASLVFLYYGLFRRTYVPGAGGPGSSHKPLVSARRGGVRGHA